MKKCVLFALFFALACATDPESAQPKDFVRRTKVSFAAVNEKVFEDMSILQDGNFSGFTAQDYETHMDQLRSTKAVELRKNLQVFDKMEIHPFQKTFIACIHHSKDNYTLCDDPRCPGVEKAGRGGKEFVEKWLRELPWSKCPRNPNTGLPY